MLGNRYHRGYRNEHTGSKHVPTDSLAFFLLVRGSWLRIPVTTGLYFFIRSVLLGREILVQRIGDEISLRAREERGESSWINRISRIFCGGSRNIFFEM